MKNTSLGRDMRLALLSNSALNKLIFANLIAAGIALLAYLALWAQFGNEVNQVWGTAKSWIGMPLNSDRFFLHIYAVFTHMFIPADVFTFLFNIFLLWSFGRIFTEFMGGKRLLPLFFYGGIAGALLALLSYQFLKGTAYWTGVPLVMGGTASVMAIMTSVTFLYPNLPLNMVIFGPLKLKYIALVNLFFAMFSLSRTQSMALYIAMVGGILFGITYAFLYRRGFDLAGGFIRLADMVKGNDYRKPQMKVTYRRPMSDDEYNTVRQEKESTLDEILDKINEKGIKSLTRKEKQLLEKYSKQ